MKRLFTTLGLIAVAAVGYAQENATDFTATDCNSTSHTLFTDLDAGKTVVMVWVMPCSACNNGTSNAFTAVQNYAAAHPGKVLYYLIGDGIGNDQCSTLQTFATNNGVDLSKVSVFNNNGNTIDEANYGGSGMPHIVIASGTDHKIWYNEKNGTGAGIVDALNKATGVNEVAQQLSFSMSPNPAGDVLNIKYAHDITRVTIISISGQVVRDISYEGGKQNPSINMSKIPAGNYMIKVQDNEGRSGIEQIVKL
ncbi:T9SS type A sorting domain-containing protein [Polluticoccus soli]|uniref:T9SS type A sorting domain-containing protein n=1 Tax=Polluticoccus soli TaxID=3034150 RepID=UPI0023E2B587|nr:T9SS type A sorting domain-containing protein [Flavipsychrobacter sp. JY13-12]